MPFQFIDNTAIDHKVRRQIRSQAASRKNAGKTIKRRSRKEGLPPNRTAFFRGPNAIHEGDPRSGAQGVPEVAPSMLHQLGDSLSTLPLPVRVPPGKRPAVKRAISFFCGVRYIPEVRSAFDGGKRPPSIWIQLMFMDEAYFHIAMAVSISSISRLATATEDAGMEMSHLSHTLRLVNQKLSTIEATRDATLAVVVMMAQYERHRGRRPEGLLHLNGLRRMVEMRGGIAKLLREHVVLGQKIIRLDLEYALETGSTTLFSVSDVVGARGSKLWLRRCRETEYSHQDRRLLHFGNLDVGLRDIAVDMSTISWLYNDAISGSRSKISMLDGCIALWELGYRLLQFSPLQEPRTPNLQGTVQLGLILFLLPFLHMLDGRIPDCRLVYELSRSAAHGYFEVAEQEADHAVLLWMLLVGASSAFPLPHDEGILSITRGLVHSLRIETWEDVDRVLAGFPWVDALFHKAGWSLFQAAMDVSPI